MHLLDKMVGALCILRITGALKHCNVHRYFSSYSPIFDYKFYTLKCTGAFGIIKIIDAL